MTNSNRTDAQQHADDIRVFRRELSRLENNDVITLSESQRRTLDDHHNQLLSQYAREFDVDHDTRTKQLSLGMRIASFIGALALSASVFFLFYQFWGRLDEAPQVAILLITAIATFAGTFWVNQKDLSGYFTKLVAMLAFACFALNLTMLGQIFNITPSDTIFLALATHALLLAYTFDMRLLLATGLLCIIGFLSARIGVFCGLYWLSFGERPENFMPVALILFAVPLLVNHTRFTHFASTYRILGLITLFLPMLALAHFGRLSYFNLDRDIIQGTYQILGFALSAGAIWLGARRSWPDVINGGICTFVLFLYTKFFSWWWDIMPKYLFFLVMGLSALLLLLVLKRLRNAAFKYLGGVQS